MSRMIGMKLYRITIEVVGQAWIGVGGGTGAELRKPNGGTWGCLDRGASGWRDHLRARLQLLVGDISGILIR